MFWPKSFEIIGTTGAVICQHLILKFSGMFLTKWHSTNKIGFYLIMGIW